MTRIGVFLGAFYPPHNGQIFAASAFMTQMWLDMLYVIPGYNMGDNIDEMTPTQENDAVVLCKNAFGTMEGVMVVPFGNFHEKKLSNVLRQIKTDDSRVFLLCGTDAFLSLNKLTDLDEVMSLAYITYVRREKDTLLDNMILQQVKQYRDKYNKSITKLQLEPVVLSSSQIREAVKNKKEINSWVPEVVEAAIQGKGLFK